METITEYKGHNITYSSYSGDTYIKLNGCNFTIKAIRHSGQADGLQQAKDYIDSIINKAAAKTTQPELEN